MNLDHYPIHELAAALRRQIALLAKGRPHGCALRADLEQAHRDIGDAVASAEDAAQAISEQPRRGACRA